VRLDPNGACASRKPHAVYWLGLRPATMPDAETVPEIIESLHRAGTRYLFIEPSGLLQRPGLAPLADPRAFEHLPAGLKLLAGGIVWSDGRGEVATLYEVIGVRPKPPAPLTPSLSRHETPRGIGRTAFVRASLGRLYLQRGLRREAREMLARLRGEEIEWRPAHEWIGDLYLFEGEPDSAAAHYRRAARLEPDAPSVWCRLASVAIVEDRPREAEESLARLGVADRAGGLAAIGRDYFSQGEYGAAIAPLLFAAMRDSTEWRSCQNLGFIAMNIQQDLEQAARFFRASLSSMPPGPERIRTESILAGLRARGPAPD